MENILYTEVDVDPSLAIFVKRFWKYTNPSANTQQYIILPDGHFDLIIKISNAGIFNISLFGLFTRELEVNIKAHSTVIGICFKPLAVEYIFKRSIANILNNYEVIQSDFWLINNTLFDDFNLWAEIITSQIKSALNGNKTIDDRKVEIFELLFTLNFSYSVRELSNAVYWNSRQINRFFQSRFGLSLKVYINILRAFESYQGIREGELAPNPNFYDQSHFIKEIKKHTGVKPLELYKNKNDRFLQFATLPKG